MHVCMGVGMGIPDLTLLGEGTSLQGGAVLEDQGATTLGSSA